MKCPECGSDNMTTTLLGFWYNKKPGPDKNRATCHACGWIGKAWEAGAPEIPPAKGTEEP